MIKFQSKIYNFFGSTETLLLALIAVTIPLKINFGNISIILSIFYVLVLIFRKKVSLKHFNHLYFYLPTIFFLIAVISALTSKDIKEGIFQLEKLTLLIFIPAIFCAFNVRKINYEKIFLCYVYGVTVSTLILLLNNVLKILDGAAIDKLFFSEFTNLYEQHPVYFSTNILISTFMIANYLNRTSGGMKLKWIVILTVTHILGLVFCASKALILCFFVFLIVFTFTTRLKLLKIRILFFGLICSVIISVAFIPDLRKRFTGGLEFDLMDFTPTSELIAAKKFTNKEKTEISDLELRFIFLKIGLYHAIQDDKILFGYGLGDVKHYTDYYYMTYNLAPNWFEGYNLHNQYLQYFVTYGIFATFLFITYLFYSLSTSISSNNMVHLSFLLMILFTFIFEVYLARNKGIILLLFFNTLFLTQNLTSENSDSWHKRYTK